MREGALKAVWLGVGVEGEGGGSGGIRLRKVKVELVVFLLPGILLRFHCFDGVVQLCVKRVCVTVSSNYV